MKKRRIDVFALTQFSYLSRPLLFRSLTLVRSSNKSRFTYIPRGIQQPSFLTARFEATFLLSLATKEARYKLEKLADGGRKKERNKCVDDLQDW